MDVIVGAFTLDKVTTVLGAAADVQGAVTRYADRFWFPKGYLKSKKAQFMPLDICVVDLEEPVDFTPALIASETSSTVPTGTSAVVYGWGDQEDVQSPPPVLRLKGLNANISCKSVTCPCPIDYTSVWQTSKAQKFICLAASATGSICHGDSGGPLILKGVVRGVLADLLYSIFRGSGCLPKSARGSLFINIAAPEIADFIAEALAK